MNVAGKVALVTGGARRVGRALRLALAEAGADVIVHYNSSASEAQDVTREIAALGRRALALQADVAHGVEVRRILREVESEWGRLDILVNSAASFESAPFLEIGEDDWERVLAINLKGPFLLMQSAAPLLRSSGEGVIVNITDLSAFQPWPSYAHHSVSKAGLVHLTRIAARALAPSIRVNCIAPGTVLPPEGYDGIGSDGTSDRRLVTPAGSPADVARALLFLVESSFITGQTIVVDGGRLLL
jgi:NAD(P)-dependent dehydrogenase (short-subunit alcohol dehydrogenase family)